MRNNVLFFLLLSHSLFASANTGMRVHFIDVGQGDATFGKTNGSGRYGQIRLHRYALQDEDDDQDDLPKFIYLNVKY